MDCGRCLCAAGRASDNIRGRHASGVLWKAAATDLRHPHLVDGPHLCCGCMASSALQGTVIHVHAADRKCCFQGCSVCFSCYMTDGSGYGVGIAAVPGHAAGML